MESQYCCASMNTYFLFLICILNFLTFHGGKIKLMSFNFLGLGSTLVIQKAYKVKGHTLVFCSCGSILAGICFGLRCLNAKGF